MFNVGLILGLLFHRRPRCAVMGARAAVSAANEHHAKWCHAERLASASPMNQHLISPPSLLSTVIPIYLALHRVKAAARKYADKIRVSISLSTLCRRRAAAEHTIIFLGLLITFQLLKQICYIECLISPLNCSRWMRLWREPVSV